MLYQLIVMQPHTLVLLIQTKINETKVYVLLFRWLAVLLMCYQSLTCSGIYIPTSFVDTN